MVHSDMKHYHSHITKSRKSVYLLSGEQRNSSRWKKTVKTNNRVCGPASELRKNMNKLQLKKMKNQQFPMTSTMESLNKTFQKKEKSSNFSLTSVINHHLIKFKNTDRYSIINVGVFESC